MQGLYEQSPPPYIGYDSDMRTVQTVQSAQTDYDLPELDLDTDHDLHDHDGSVDLINTDMDQLQLSLEIEKER